MRLTTSDLKDPHKCRLALRCRVLVNGRSVTSCIVADEELGYVTRYVAPESLPADRSLWPASFPVETLRGRVEIIDPEKQ